MTKFQLTLTGIFAICIVIGVGMFALSKGTLKSPVNLVVWGTISPEVFDTAYKNSSLPADKMVQISYVKKDQATFDTDFLEALASGVGPDIVILREDFIYKNRNKLFTIPYSNYTARDFKDRFIQGGEIFLASDGVIALPFLLDPMVMYWNRDMFSNNAIAQTPKYWDEIYSMIEKMTKKNSSGTIIQSAIGFGEWNNITNAKEIISTLLLQAGTPITSRTSYGVVSVLNSQFDLPIAPSQSAINFYTQFSNPTSPAYSWNRSLPTSQNFFLSGNLAMYLGFASEISSIQQKNANLNFDVTSVPQIRDSAKKITFGHMHALSIVKQSKQIAGAFIALNALTESTPVKALESATNLPPVRRDLLGVKPTNSFKEVFYNSALLSRAWIDPDSVASAKTFRDIIESITSGKARLTEALSRANDELEFQLK